MKTDSPNRAGLVVRYTLFFSVIKGFSFTKMLKKCTFDFYDYYKTIYCCMLEQHLWKLPEDGDYADTCRSKLTLKYTVYRIVHLLVLIKFVIQ